MLDGDGARRADCGTPKVPECSTQSALTVLWQMLTQQIRQELLQSPSKSLLVRDAAERCCVAKKGCAEPPTLEFNSSRHHVRVCVHWLETLQAAERVFFDPINNGDAEAQINVQTQSLHAVGAVKIQVDTETGGWSPLPLINLRAAVDDLSANEQYSLSENFQKS